MTVKSTKEVNEMNIPGFTADMSLSNRRLFAKGITDSALQKEIVVLAVGGDTHNNPGDCFSDCMEDCCPTCIETFPKACKKACKDHCRTIDVHPGPWPKDCGGINHFICTVAVDFWAAGCSAEGGGPICGILADKMKADCPC